MYGVAYLTILLKVILAFMIFGYVYPLKHPVFLVLFFHDVFIFF